MLWIAGWIIWQVFVLIFAFLVYALLFGGPRQRKTVTLLRERGAVE